MISPRAFVGGDFREDLEVEVLELELELEAWRQVGQM
jgi:hypothetical protein